MSELAPNNPIETLIAYADQLEALYSEFQQDREEVRLNYIESIVTSLRQGNVKRAKETAFKEWDKLKYGSELKAMRDYLLRVLFNDEEPLSLRQCDDEVFSVR